MSTSTQSVALIIGAVVIAALGYFVFMKSDDFSLSPDATSPLSDMVLAKTQAFIEHGAALDQVVISTEIFNDPRFTTLRSFTPTLKEETIGRPNPFEGGVVSATNASGAE